MLSTFSHRVIVRLVQFSLLGGLLLMLAAAPRAGYSAPEVSTWYVASSGSDLNDCLSANAACEHIQTVINRSGSGDTVNIAAGIYFETLEIPDKSLTLKGEGAATTIIDGLQQKTVLNIFADTSRVITISGLTLQNGKASNPGGGISAEAKISLNLLDTNIISNTATFGGGIFNQGVLSLNNVLLGGNQATGDALSEGGGIWNTGAGELNGVTLVNNVASRGGGISNLNVMTVTGSVIGSNRVVGNYGGGIYNRGGASQLTLINSVVNNNQAIGTSGGGIYNDHILISNGSIISGNLALSQGGGIYNNASGLLFFSNSSFYNNTARDEGGSLFNAGEATFESIQIIGNVANKAGGGTYNGASGTLAIETSAISNNTATGLQGGGIANLGTLTLRHSALTNNAASVAQGGGLYNAGTAELTAVTISDNTATGGGGIQNDGGTAQIKFSTISGNTGSPALNNASGSVSVANSILAASAGVACGGSITTGTHNIDSGNSCGFIPANLDQFNTNPQLGPLQDNGGNSLTRAIAFSSPARDTAASCPPPADVDQRGINRPQGPKCDRGAYEVIGYNGPGGSILPNQCVNTTLTINESLLIGRAQVGVNLAYANRAELIIKIYTPNNRPVTLLGPAANAGKDLNTLFDDNAAAGVPAGDQDAASPSLYENIYKPSTLLAQLRNLNVKGTWKLEICNNSANSGTLNSWVIVVPEVGKPKVYLPLIRRGK